MSPEAKSQDKQVLILIGVVGLILCIAYVNFLLKPSIANLKKINPRLIELTENIRRAESEIMRQAAIEDRVKDLKSGIEGYEIVLSSEEELPSLLEELSEKAHESNVKIIGIKPKKIVNVGSRQKTPYREIPISIKAKCGYHQLGDFIARLEGADRLFVISDIEIAGVLQTPRRHNITLIVSTFLPPER